MVRIIVLIYIYIYIYMVRRTHLDGNGLFWLEL